MGAPKSDSHRLVQHWFFERLEIIQKCSEEKIHLFKGTIKVKILIAIPTD